MKDQQFLTILTMNPLHVHKSARDNDHNALPHKQEWYFRHLKVNNPLLLHLWHPSSIIQSCRQYESWAINVYIRFYQTPFNSLLTTTHCRVSFTDASLSHRFFFLLKRFKCICTGASLPLLKIEVCRINQHVENKGWPKWENFSICWCCWQHQHNNPTEGVRNTDTIGKVSLE